jgi:aspartate aminotransferase-like enzyme
VNLRIPGPTTVPVEVAQAGATEMINHRGPEFAALIARTTEGVKKVYQTQNDVLTLTASGSGAMESAVVNFTAPGDHSLVVSIGNFGDRFANLVKIYGGVLTKQEYEGGQAADLNKIEDALKADPQIRTVFITHNETSTGVTNPVLPELAALVHAHDALVVVDAISSLSSIEVDTDGWGLDVVLSGSQKGWMVAPGLAFASVNERAWARAEETASKQPRFYFDLKRHKDSLANGQTPWTPAVSLFFQLDKALEMMFAEGLEGIYARHRRIGNMVRDGVRGMGLELLADEGVESDTVTAFWLPDGINGSQVSKIAREKYGTVFAGGQGNLTGKIMRFGHLGAMTDEDIQAGLDALKSAFADAGFKG